MPVTPSKEDIALYARSLPLLNSATQLEQQGHPTSTSLLPPGAHATLSSSGLLFLDPLLHMMYHIPPFRHAVFSLKVGGSTTPPLDPSGAAGWWLQRLYAGLSVGVKRSVSGSETLLEALGWEVEGALASHDVSTVMASIFQAMAGADSVMGGKGEEEEEEEKGEASSTTTSPALAQLLQTFGGRWGAPSSEEEEWGSWIDVTLPMPTTPFLPAPPEDSEVLVGGGEEEGGNTPFPPTPFTDIHRGLREVCPLVVGGGGGGGRGDSSPVGGASGGEAIPPVIPPFLVLHTPRFNAGVGEATGAKLSRNDTPLSIPFQLPLTPFFTPSSSSSSSSVLAESSLNLDMHNLHAALVHSPGGVGYGALCKVMCNADGEGGEGGGGDSWVYYQGSTAAPISAQGVRDVLAGLPCITPSIPAHTLSVTLIYASTSALSGGSGSSSISSSTTILPSQQQQQQLPPLLIPSLTPDTTPAHLLTLLPAIQNTFTTPATLFVATQCEDTTTTTTTTLLLTLSHRYRRGCAGGAGLLPLPTLAALHGENLVACALAGAQGVAAHVATVRVHVPEVIGVGGGGRKGGGSSTTTTSSSAGVGVHPYLLPPRSRSPTATITLHFPRTATMWRVQEEVYDAWLAGAGPPGVVRGGRASLAAAAALYAKEGGSAPAFPMRRDVRLRAWEEPEGPPERGGEGGRAFESFSSLEMASSPLCPPTLYHPQYQGPTPTACFALEVRPFSLLTPGLSEDDVPTPELLCEWKAWGVEVPRGGRIVGVRLWTPALESSLTGVVDRVFGDGVGGVGSSSSTGSGSSGSSSKEHWEKPPSLWLVLKEGEAANPAAILRAFTLKHPELTAGLQKAAGVTLPPPSSAAGASMGGSGEGGVPPANGGGGLQHPVTCAILPFPLAKAVGHWVSPTSTSTSTTPSLTTLLRARASQTNFTPSLPTPLLPSSSEGLVVLPTLTLPMAPPPKPTGPKMMAKFGSKVLIPVGGGGGGAAAAPSPPPSSPAQLEECAAVQGYAHLDLLGVCGVSDGDEVVIIPHATRQVSVGVVGGGGGEEDATTTTIPPVASKAINTLRALCGLRSYSSVGGGGGAVAAPVAMPMEGSSSTTTNTSPMEESPSLSTATASIAAAGVAPRGTPIRLLIIPPSPLPPDLATPTTTPEDLMIWGYSGKRAGVQRVVSSRAAKAIAAAAAAAAAASPTLEPFTFVAHREMSVGELKGRIVAALQAKGMGALTPERMHLSKGGEECGSGSGSGGVCLRCEEDTLASVDIGEGGRVCLVYGPPLPPLSILLHVRITLPSPTTSSSTTTTTTTTPTTTTPIPLEVSFPFPLTSRVSSLRRTLFTQLSEGGFLPPAATTPAFLRLRASQAPTHTPSPTVSRVLRNESVLRSVLPAPLGGAGSSGSGSGSGGSGGSGGGGDERHLTVEVLAMEEIIRPGDAVVKLRQLATPGDGTPCGAMLVEVMAAAEEAAGGVGGEGEEGSTTTDPLNHAQLCPPIDAILPTGGGAESSSSSSGGGGGEVTLGTLQRAVSGALSSASPPHNLTLPPTCLALAVLGAYGPALTTWEACNRLEWGATSLKVSEGCTVVWRVVEGGGGGGEEGGEGETAAAVAVAERAAASAGASGGGVRAISALRSKVGEVEKENGIEGGRAGAAAAKRPTPWELAKRGRAGGKPPTHAASGGSDDVEILVPKKRNQ